MKINVNQILGSSIKYDDDGTPYATVRVSQGSGSEDIELRMNVAQAGILASSLDKTGANGEDALNDLELGRRSLSAIQPNLQVE